MESALALVPDERPEPAALAWTLRSSLVRSPRRRGQRVRVARGVLAGRLVHAGSSATFVAAALTFFPFFPPSFTLPMAAAVGGVAFARPRLGLFLALTIPVFPLGDVSSGLAWAYGVGALAYFAVMAREPSGGLVAVAGPLLAAAGALALAPLLALPLRGALRRGLVAGLAVLAAVLYTSLYGLPLPFTGAAAPLGLGIPDSESPTAVAAALAGFLAAHPAIIAAACTLAVAAVLAPAAIRASAWPLAFGCAAVLALLILGPTLAFDASVTTMPTIAYTWLAFAVLAVPVAVRLRRQSLAEQPRPHTAASSHEVAGQPPKTSSPIVADEPSLANVWAQVIERETAAARALRSEAAGALRS